MKVTVMIDVYDDGGLSCYVAKEGQYIHPSVSGVQRFKTVLDLPVKDSVPHTEVPAGVIEKV